MPEGEGSAAGEAEVGGHGSGSFPQFTEISDKANGAEMVRSIVGSLKELNAWLGGLVSYWDSIVQESGAVDNESDVDKMAKEGSLEGAPEDAMEEGAEEGAEEVAEEGAEEGME